MKRTAEAHPGRFRQCRGPARAVGRSRGRVTADRLAVAHLHDAAGKQRVPRIGFPRGPEAPGRTLLGEPGGLFLATASLGSCRRS
jgi:hypothetical protein